MIQKQSGPPAAADRCRGVFLLLLHGLLFSCADQATERKDGTGVDPGAPGQAVRMDGLFGDWEGAEVLSDDTGDAPEAELDLGTVQVRSDDQYVNFSLGLNRVLNVQRLDGTLELMIDGDGDPGTGAPRRGMPGVDLNVVFSPEDPARPEADNMGVAVSSTTYAPTDPAQSIHHTDIGFTLAPTYASDRIECRIDRGAILPETPVLFHGKSISLKLALIDGEGNVADETEVISHPLPQNATPRTAGADLAGSLPPRPADALRITAWNVENGSILKKQDLYSKILTLLDSDVLLLEEVRADSAEALRAFFREQVARPGESWEVVFGGGGGPSRCVIASRRPISPVGSLESIAYPDRPDRSVRTVGGIVTMGGRRILVAPMHLKCCGRVDSREDEKRLQESELINEGVRAAAAQNRFDGVVIGGDLNLVGGREPIERLGANLDADQSELSVLNPYHLHGRKNTTWSSPRERFAPGQLDFLLYSDSSLEAASSFVFDTADFSDPWLSVHALTRDTSTIASDHFPIVADFSWRE